MLCGEIHPVHFHEKRERTFRYDFAGNSQKNKVYRIKCTTAQEAGNQYTLTILPHFLLPGCLVRADDVFSAGMDADIRRDIKRKGCDSLDVLEERTVRKHLSRFNACLTDFVISLAAIISEFGENLPDKKPEKCSLVEDNISWFKELTPRIISIRGKLFGFENLSIEDIAALFHFFIHPSYPAATCTDFGHKGFPIILRAPP